MNDPRIRKAFGYRLRASVSHQDGADSLAPSLIFADADYDIGDGRIGLHEDDKQANEPAIIYVRADAYLDACAQVEALAARLADIESKEPEA